MVRSAAISISRLPITSYDRHHVQSRGAGLPFATGARHAKQHKLCLASGEAFREMQVLLQRWKQNVS